MKTPNINMILGIDGLESHEGYVSLPVESIEKIERAINEMQEFIDSPSTDIDIEEAEWLEKEDLSNESIELLDDMEIKSDQDYFNIPFELLKEFDLLSDKEWTKKVFNAPLVPINDGKVGFTIGQFNILTSLNAE